VPTAADQCYDLMNVICEVY